MRKLLHKFLNWIYLLTPNKKGTEEYLKNWGNSLVHPSKYYLVAYQYFNLYLDPRLKEHRAYFQQEQRGFGESAFHTMWYMLYKKFKFQTFLEIGVYRGQVISLVSYLGKLDNHSILINGISPFDKSGDTVSEYIDIDYMQDIYSSFAHFKLNKPTLINAYSTEETAVNAIESRLWDCIYIDGSHDYDIVNQDWDRCAKNVKPGGLIILDDASLNTSYKPYFFSFKGHPGPSKVADEVDNTKFKEILRVGHNRVFQKVLN